MAFIMCLDTIKQVLFEPKKFFNSLAKRKHYNLGDALRFLLTVGVFYVLMSLLVQLLFSALGVTVQGMLGSKMDKMMMPFVGGLRFVFNIIGAVFQYAGLIISSFVSALIVWLWLMLWGGKGDYQKAYSLYIYAMTPVLVLGWLPLVGGLVAGIWNLVLLILGTIALYNMPTKKAVLIWVLPIVILTILFFLLIGSLVALGVGLAFLAN
jgi:hypothetical protein